MFNFQDRRANNFLDRGNSSHLNYGKNSRSYEQQIISRNMNSFEHRYKNSHRQSLARGLQQRHTRGVNYLFQNPRSFEELHIERGYLINNLQFEDAKATELLKQIADLQECIRQGQEPKARRSCQKTLNWLMRRMNGTTRQERWILQRLGQVTQEIQNRERMSRIEDERNGLYFLNGMQLLQLNPNTPEFTPHPYCHQQWNVGDDAVEYDKDVSHELAAPVELAENGDSEGQMEMPCGVVGQGRTSSLMEGDKLPLDDRRLSMPTLPRGFFEESPESEPLYLGYYMSD